jgi:hypothetical protein
MLLLQMVFMAPPYIRIKNVAKLAKLSQLESD